MNKKLSKYSLLDRMLAQFYTLNRYVRFFLIVVFLPISLTIFVLRLNINKIAKVLIITILWILVLPISSSNDDPVLDEVKKDSVIDQTELKLSSNYVELYEGQVFNASSFLENGNTGDVTIIDNVDVTKPGEYSVTFKTETQEDIITVVIKPFPFDLNASSLTFEVGDDFNPNDYVVSNNDVKIINNVDTSKEGLYTIVYSFDGVEKKINVTITKPKTIQNVETSTNWVKDTIVKIGFENNRIIEVSNCDLSGTRESNVVVDVGFGDRSYWAFTNNYGQLVAVIAETIVLQDDNTEAVNQNGRYCSDEAKVSGTEASDLDEGHVIADSLGGVANAYNITPQNSILNRYGDQSYLEDWIVKAGGVSEFVAIISYPNNITQIPQHYSFSYIMNGTKITDEFDNVNPEANNSNTQSENQSSSSGSSTVVKSNAIITQSGLEIASNHVFKNCDEVKIYFPDGFQKDQFPDLYAVNTARDRDKDGWACEP